MDLKISDPMQSNALGGAGRTEGATGLAGRGGKPNLRSVGSTGSDRIEISSLTGRIAEGLSAASARRSDRVSQLTALYSSGRYAASAENVSRAMIAHALGNKTSEVA
jgi:hypothetical protein